MGFSILYLQTTQLVTRVNRFLRLLITIWLEAFRRYLVYSHGHSMHFYDLYVECAFCLYVESGGSTRSSREDLYSSRGYRGSNSSLNDGRWCLPPSLA